MTEGTTESVQTETLGGETGLSLLLRLNGLSVQQQTDAEAALQRIASASKAARAAAAVTTLLPVHPD